MPVQNSSERACLTCSAPVPATLRRDAVYCCGGCRDRANKEKRAARRTARRTSLRCRTCDAPIENAGHSGARYCSQRCKDAFRWKFDRDGEARRNRGVYLRLRYGITLEDYEAMLTAQGGGCAICGNTENVGGNGRWLSVDHDHALGHIRGLLCGACNIALGQMRDRPDLLRRAATYLESHATDRPAAREVR